MILLQKFVPRLPHVSAALFSGLNLTGVLPVRPTRFLRINALVMPGLPCPHLNSPSDDRQPMLVDSYASDALIVAGYPACSRIQQSMESGNKGSNPSLFWTSANDELTPEHDSQSSARL